MQHSTNKNEDIQYYIIIMLSVIRLRQKWFIFLKTTALTNTRAVVQLLKSLWRCIEYGFEFELLPWASEKSALAMLMAERLKYCIERQI